jgi:hypothetical protein
LKAETCDYHSRRLTFRPENEAAAGGAFRLRRIFCSGVIENGVSTVTEYHQSRASHKARPRRAKRFLSAVFHGWEDLPPPALAERLAAARSEALRRVLSIDEWDELERMTARMHANSNKSKVRNVTLSR